MRVLRLIVPSQIRYTLNVLSQYAGVQLPDRQVIDVPLYDGPQIQAAERLAAEFNDGSGRLHDALRNGANAIVVYHACVVEI